MSSLAEHLKQQRTAMSIPAVGPLRPVGPVSGFPYRRLIHPGAPMHIHQGVSERPVQSCSRGFGASERTHALVAATS